MAEQLNILPTELVAGESLSATVSISGYSSADGWALSYRFATYPTPIAVTGAAASGGAWTVALTNAQTLTLPSGPLRFDAIVSKATVYAAVDTGTIAVTASPMLASKWATVLESVEAAIATWGTSDQRSMTIEGMSVSYRSIDELLKLRAFCIRHIARETGNRRPSRILARFTL